MTAQHREPSRDPTPWRFGLVIVIVIAVVVIGCFSATVWILFNGDPSVQPAIRPGTVAPTGSGSSGVGLSLPSG